MTTLSRAAQRRAHPDGADEQQSGATTPPESERLTLQYTDAFEYDVAEVVRQGLHHVTHNGRVALLAVPMVGRGPTVSGVYDRLNRAVADVVACERERRFSIYARLQPLLKAVPTTNCLRPGLSINSEMVAGLWRLVLDVDAPRKANEAPTVDGIAFAHDVATVVWAVLLRAGIPREALTAVQTGHGVHIIIACHLSGIGADIQLWRDILGSLADALTRRGLGGELIDQGVADLTRNTRIPGTTNVKYADEPAAVWLLRPWGGAMASLELLESIARRGRSLRELVVQARLARQKKAGAFPTDYRPQWVRDLLTNGARDGYRHKECRRLVGWFITYAPNEAEQAVDSFVAASGWDGTEAHAILRHYRRLGRDAA